MNKAGRKMTSKEMLKFYSDNLFEEAMEKKKKGGLICWSSSVMCGEFFEAMDISVIYPENHAAIIGAKHYSTKFLEYAEKMGYDSGICSYAKINISYTNMLINDRENKILKECPAPVIPLPDVIAVCNNICSLLIKWYENLAKMLNVPFVLVDVPYIHDGEISNSEVKYILGQFENIKKTLEKLTGKAFNEEKLSELIKQRELSARAWGNVMKIAEKKNSPLNGFDLFNYMSLAVCASYKKEAQEVFEAFYKELEEKKEGDGENGVFWEGIACWPYLSMTYKTLKNNGFKITASTYPEMWNLKYSSLEEMAKAYAQVYTNTSLENKIKLISKMGGERNCEAYVYHRNKSCKLMSFMIKETAEGVKKITGKPYIIFDGDQTDPGNFSRGQFETKIQALSEMTEE